MREESFGPIANPDGSPSAVTIAMLAGTGRDPEAFVRGADRLDGLVMDPANGTLPQHIIPVAFEVYAADEAEAVHRLVQALVRGNVLGGRVESWSTPNHPWADGSDDEGQRLQWVQLTTPDEVADGEPPTHRVSFVLTSRDTGAFVRYDDRTLTEARIEQESGKGGLYDLLGLNVDDVLYLDADQPLQVTA